MRNPAIRTGIAALGLISLAAPAAEERKTPRDAAEAVQEGNVQNWIEYYQRTRPPAPPPATPRSAGASTPEPAPAPPPAKDSTPTPSR